MLDLMQGLENYKVYHYTDLNAFINIIRNEDIVLRATNCLYLNDSNEIVEGVKSVERVIQKKIDVGAFGFYLAHFVSLISHNARILALHINGCSGVKDGVFLLLLTN